MIKLLIADDEPIVLETMFSLLNWSDYGIDQPIIANNGESAFKLFIEHKPQIVITDIRMPKVDGIELITKIRQLDDKTNIIIFSAYSEFEYAQKAIGLAVTGYLLKPLHVNEFKKTISAVSASININKASNEYETLSYKKVIRDVISYVNIHYMEEITLTLISEYLFVDYHYLSKLFKKETGKLFSTYLTEFRIEKAKEFLQNPDVKVYEVSEMIGYSDVKHFRKVFKELESITPGQYSKYHSAK